MSVMLEQITGDTHDHANMKDGFETEFVCAGVLIFFFKCWDDDLHEYSTNFNFFCEKKKKKGNREDIHHFSPRPTERRAVAP